MSFNPESIEEIHRVFDHIQEAKRQIEILKIDLKSIKHYLLKVEKLSVFDDLRESTSGAEKENETSPEPTVAQITVTTKYDVEHITAENSDQPRPKKLKYDFPMKDGYVEVYTDGSCENNGAPNAKAGFGVWFSNNHPLNQSGPVEGKPTNNVAEIQACIRAVEIALKNDIKKLRIYTDSGFLVNAMTKWIANWKRKDWKLYNGKEVKNRRDFQKLDQLSTGLDIQWVHVNGHCGIKGNEMADQLAKEGARKYKC